MSGTTCDVTGCKWNDGDGNCVRDGIYISDRFTKVAMCMSDMNYQEAIAYFEKRMEFKKKEIPSENPDIKQADNKLRDIYTTAISAMLELQQYKAIGTLEEVRAAVKRHMEIAPKVLVSSQDTKIGNVTFRKGTKTYKCGCCKSFVSRSSKYCHECGQAIDWSVIEC